MTPYIPEERRDPEKVDPRVLPKAGDLAYVLSRMVDQYVAEKGLDYQTISDIQGALETTKQEFYRRFAAPYEDRKLEANGEVFTVTAKELNP